jgi:hypothetical protein
VSNCTCTVYRDGKPVAWSVYNRTADVLCADMHSGPTEAWESLTTRPNRRAECAAQAHDPVPVVIQNDADGYWWHSTACFDCMTVIGEVYPLGCYEDEKPPCAQYGDPPGCEVPS